MDALGLAFGERLQEIESYLELLKNVELEARTGPPRLTTTKAIITTTQQKILYSGVFLQLYNLVEATVVSCLDSVTDAAIKNGTWSPGDLTIELRTEWVRVMARTHIDLSSEKRLQSALSLCGHLVEKLPVRGFQLEKGGGGNWDDVAIQAVAARLGFKIIVSPEIHSKIKRNFKDDLGPLALVKNFRNSLAHGSISFVEGGENITVSELSELTKSITGYLQEVVTAFGTYISQFEYLVPNKRPG